MSYSRIPERPYSKPYHQENGERVFHIDREGTEFHYLLWGHRLRATEARLKLLEFLSNKKTPISAAEITEGLSGVCDKATTYRSLESLVKVGLVNRIDTVRDRAHFEFVTGRGHHHHITCMTCGLMEDVSGCDFDEINRQAISSGLKKFKHVERHTLEFFGVCVKCESDA